MHALANLGTASGLSIRQVLEAVARIGGKEVPHYNAGRRVGDPPELVADTALSRQLLGDGLTPHSDIDTIVRTALNWRRDAVYATISELVKSARVSS